MLRELEQQIVANGKVESAEIDVLRRQLYADGKIGRTEADFLVMLHKRVQRRSPAFEKFFYQAIKDHILADAAISAEETAWLRQMLEHDGVFTDEERKFLRELRGEARQLSAEFEEFFMDSIKQPPERHTSG